MKNKLYALEFLRIYACILVYFWHIGRDTADSNPLFIFFVLSGFVIAWRYFPANGKLTLRGTLGFWQRRIAKIYPAHIAVVLMSIVVRVWSQLHGKPECGFHSPADFGKQLLQSVTLTQSWALEETYRFRINGVAWFISALAFYWLLTPLLLAGLRRLRRGAAIFAVAAVCTVLYAYMPGWLPAGHTTHPFLYLPLYVEGLALGSLYVLLLQKPAFAQAKTARAVMATVFAAFYFWQIYAPAQLRVPWLLPYGATEVPIWLLVFGFAQDLGPLRLLGNKAVRFLAARVMEIYLVHQVWFLYVDELREGLLRRELFAMSTDLREVFRLVGTLVLAELLHTVLPRLLTVCGNALRKWLPQRKEISHVR